MLAHLILFLSIVASAQEGAKANDNVVYPIFGAKKKSCVVGLGAHQAVRPEGAVRRRLYESILEAIDALDPARVHVHVDFTSKIWEWEPTDEKKAIRIRFGRDDAGYASRVFVVRKNYEQDLIVETPEWVTELDEELRRRLPAATVSVVDDLDALRLRPWPTAGLLL